MGNARKKPLLGRPVVVSVLCTEVPIGRAGRDTAAYRPLGISCSGHHPASLHSPERGRHLKPEAASQKGRRPLVGDAGVGTRPEHTPCSTCTRVHARLAPPPTGCLHAATPHHPGRQLRPRHYGVNISNKLPGIAFVFLNGGQWLRDGCCHMTKHRLARWT